MTVRGACHCEPQGGAAIHGFGGKAGLLRCARNDGLGWRVIASRKAAWRSMVLVGRLDCFAALAMTAMGACHCEPQGGVAIHGLVGRLDCFAVLAMTAMGACHCEPQGGVAIHGLVGRLDCFAALAMTVRGACHCEPQGGAAIHGFGGKAGLLRCARNDGEDGVSLRAARRRGNPWFCWEGWIASLRSQRR